MPRGNEMPNPLFKRMTGPFSNLESDMMVSGDEKTGWWLRVPVAIGSFYGASVHPLAQRRKREPSSSST
jgi:hypothetical protein